MSTPTLAPVAFETRHGNTVVKSLIKPWKGDTPDTFSARIERYRTEAKHRAEQLEPVRKREHREKRHTPKTWTLGEENPFADEFEDDL